MKTLIYVPVIHTSADLGRVAPEVNKKGKALLGERNWARHKEVILGFWNSITYYFNSLKVKGFKIYQDGLIANGEVGKQIVSDGVKRGSRNYKIVSKLIGRGAELIKTEDFPLVKKEYDYIIKIAKSKSFLKRLVTALNYRFRKGRLLQERDEFIAQTIDKTLKEGETGILFLGAHHDILSKLPKDIKVKEVKKRERIEKYQRGILTKKGRRGLEELAKYLVSPVT